MLTMEYREDETDMLTLDSRHDDATRALIVTLCGEAGMAELDVMDSGFKKLMATRPPLVIVDLSGLKFASSTALGKLIDVQRTMTRHGGRMMLSGAGLTVSNVIRSARLDQYFEVYANLNEALIEAAAMAKALGFEGLGH